MNKSIFGAIFCHGSGSENQLSHTHTGDHVLKRNGDAETKHEFSFR